MNESELQALRDGITSKYHTKAEKEHAMGTLNSALAGIDALVADYQLGKPRNYEGLFRRNEMDLIPYLTREKVAKPAEIAAGIVGLYKEKAGYISPPSKGVA